MFETTTTCAYVHMYIFVPIYEFFVCTIRFNLDKCILINDLLLHLLFLINQLLVQADLLYHFERVIMI